MPEFSAFERADELARELFALFPEDIDDDKKDIYYKIPGPYMEKDIIDTNLFSALGLLSMGQIYLKDIYRNASIPFKEENYLDDDKSASAVAPYMTHFIKDEMTHFSDVGYIMLNSAEKIVEAIETQFQFFSDYNSRKTTPSLDADVRERVDKIVEIAGYGMKMADILEGHSMLTEGGSMRSVMTRLQDGEELFEVVKREDTYDYLRNILDVHAKLNHLTFNDDVWAFDELIGDDVSAVMRLATIYHRNFAGVSDLQVTGEKKLVIPDRDKFRYIEGSDSLDKYWKDDWVGLLADMMKVDEDVMDILQFTKSPFRGLDGRLHAVGIPFHTARKLTRDLSIHLNQRTDPFYEPDEKRDVYSDIELPNDDPNYIHAIRRVIEKVTGKEPNKISFKFFNESEEGIANADGIQPITYVAKWDSERIKVLSERTSRLPVHREVDRAKKQYIDEDIYTRKNVGVCFILDYGPTNYLMNPAYSTIECRDKNADIGDFDTLAATMQNLEVDMHETVHAAQVDGRLLWRDVMSNVLYWACSTSIKQKEIGRLDMPIPDTSIKYLADKGKTWREGILEFVDKFAAITLGKGEIAENMRKRGIYEALYDIDDGLDDGDVDLLRLSDIVEMETSSKTAKYLNQVRTAIEEDDFDTIYGIEQEVEDYMYELLAITETMAEAFAITALKDYVSNSADHTIHQEGEQYVDSLVSQIRRKGNMAKDFVEIWSQDIATDVKEEQLGLKGMSYKRTIENGQDEKGVDRILMDFDADPLDIYSIYDTMGVLEGFVDAKDELTMDDVLIPMNYAKAILGIRYSANVDLLLDVIDKNGPQKAFEQITYAESFEDIAKCL